MNTALVKTWAACMPDNGAMLIAADAFAENGDTKMEMLLRMYANDLTEIGTFKFDELQKQIKVDDERGNGYYFTNPLGYFYTTLSVNCSVLLDNLSLIEQQPIRHLYINEVQIQDKNDLQRLLKSYRIGNLKTLNIRFSRTRRQVEHPEQLVNELNGLQLETLWINNIVDSYRHMELAFAMNNRIKKGCKLSINAQFIRAKN